LRDFPPHSAAYIRLRFHRNIFLQLNMIDYSELKNTGPILGDHRAVTAAGDWRQSAEPRRGPVPTGQGPPRPTLSQPEPQRVPPPLSPGDPA
jgi:hypothetical protein